MSGRYESGQEMVEEMVADGKRQSGEIGVALREKQEMTAEEV